jgi:hypothetical protein
MTFWRKKNTVAAKAWLDKHYSDFATGKSTVDKWFAKFKRGEMSIGTPERRCYRRKHQKSPQNNFK